MTLPALFRFNRFGLRVRFPEQVADFKTFPAKCLSQYSFRMG